jgi:hypothetical protein
METVKGRIEVFSLLFLLLTNTACLTANGVPRNLAGGYAPAELSGEVKAAADFAVTEQSKRELVPLKLMRISGAERQIVAGTNYRFILIADRSGLARQARVEVFRDLKSHFWLKSWEWL